MDRMGFTLTELLVLIVTIAISVATHLYRRGLAFIDEMKAFYNKIEALFNKTKKSARDCLAGIDANLDVYILETV
jgi:Tfp pilus assembly major pilin PilA